MLKKITVIGGSGFVGTNLCRRLAVAQRDFEIIDLKMSNQFADKCKIGDVRDIQSLRQAITGDLVINLAAVHRDDVRDKSEYQRTNVTGAENVAIVCEEKGIKFTAYRAGHVLGAAIEVHRDAGLRARAIACHHHGSERIEPVGIHAVEWPPAQAIGRERGVRWGCGEQRRAVIARERRMRGGRPQAIEPRPAIFVARRGEGGAAQLLGIEAERRALRRIAAKGEGTGHGLGGEMVAEAGHVVGHHLPFSLALAGRG